MLVDLVAQALGFALGILIIVALGLVWHDAPPLTKK